MCHANPDVLKVCRTKYESMVKSVTDANKQKNKAKGSVSKKRKTSNSTKSKEKKRNRSCGRCLNHL